MLRPAGYVQHSAPVAAQNAVRADGQPTPDFPVPQCSCSARGHAASGAVVSRRPVAVAVLAGGRLAQPPALRLVEPRSSPELRCAGW